MIELSTQLIHASIAAILRDIDSNAEIFDNPTQQGTPYPAWYIVHRQPVERQRECGNRYMLVYGIDIWYMLQQNITRMYDQYTQVAERLQDVMEYLPIYGHPGVLIHTYENSWNLELNAMKYSITLRVVGNDDIGIVNNLTSIISKDEKLVLRSINIDSHDGLFSGNLVVMLEDTSRLEALLKKLRTVRGVKQVERI